jgi:flagellar basal-body rod modification protein FlgD
MAAIDPLASSSAVGTTPAPVNKTAMSSTDFMKVMLQQLAHQDPLNPTDSNQLLSQMSEISQLQSNQDMQTNISSLTLQQSIGAAGNLIGKEVQGLTETGDSALGAVTSVRVANKTVYLQLDNGKTLPMKNVTAITDLDSLNASAATAKPPAAATPAASNDAATQLLQYLQSLAGNNTPSVAA